MHLCEFNSCKVHIELSRKQDQGSTPFQFQDHFYYSHLGLCRCRQHIRLAMLCDFSTCYWQLRLGLVLVHACMHTQVLARISASFGINVHVWNGCTGASQNERKRKDGFIFKLELNSLYYILRMYAEVMADTRGEPGEIFPKHWRTQNDLK